MPAVKRSIEIQANPHTVWNLLSTQEGLRQWLEPTMEIDMRVGGFHRHRNQFADIDISGYVLELVPEKTLVLSWREEEGDWQFPIRLSFSLEAIPGGTRVTMEFDGFAGIGKPTWDRTLRAYERGMVEHATLESLKRVAESIAAD